jgi:hypothetical protein
VRRFRDLSETDAIQEAPGMDLGLFLTQPPSTEVTDSDAVEMIKKYWKKAVKKFPWLTKIQKGFFDSLCNIKATIRIPAPGRKPSGLYPIAAVFRTFPCIETLTAFRDATRSLCATEDKTVLSDALAEVRVNGSPVFEYFSNLAFHRDPADKRRAVWFEFDLAAFIEAIKAPHRYFQDTQARQKAASALCARITDIEDKGSQSTDDEAEISSTFGFAEDNRIELLREVVTNTVRGLAYLAEGSGTNEYTIQERTLRGWNVIREKWRSLAKNNETTAEKLWAVVVSEQRAHRDDFGSSMLYKKLAETRYHPIWRDKGSREWHTDDPLRAWLQYTELRLDLKDKARQIRFTPAHAVHSPRFFIFPKKPASGGRWGSEHEKGKMVFTAGIAVRDGDKWLPQMMRLHYSAPRLKRDELRRMDEQNLESAPWVQPMMKAFGLSEPAQQNFGNCRIMLQPSNPENIQLTFPVEVKPAELIAYIGKQEMWARQFNVTPDGDKFRDATLRWPHEKQPSKPQTPWHEKLDRFTSLSVDLGQRDAGAYALLDIRANHDFGKKPARFLGETNGKTWYAALIASGLLRLSGEDRMEWRVRTLLDDLNDKDRESGSNFRKELHGSRGRMPRDFETKDCSILLEAFLGVEDAKQFLLPGWDDPQSTMRLSFPEQNDKLLVAARRAQSRVARLHRWCWFLGDSNKQGSALAEIRDLLGASINDGERWLPANLREFTVKDNDSRLPEELIKLLKNKLNALPDLLVQVANRIVPLRGRSWKWGRHPETTELNQIHLLTQEGPPLDNRERPVWLRGQRGLSIKRIEQIEELRKRFQSLNQTLRRDIGGKPPTRRDESVPDPCPELLDKLDHIKEQRVNQTAHMILAEALGVRLAKPPINKAELRSERDQHGVYEKCRSPVDFIIIEDLSRYRTSQGRSPRENSRLMKWCHRAVRDKLRELCEPFGLPVLETPAAYSSRFCSRTGVPGFRAIEVSAGFENEVPWCWLKDKQNADELTEEAKFVRHMAEELSVVQKELEASQRPKHLGQKTPRRTLLLPQAGGPIFIPVADANPNGELNSAVVQADINAAINLGLRAISDPRLWEIHPRLRTERISGEIKRRGGKNRSNETTIDTRETLRLRAREKRKYGENGPELKLGTLPKGSAAEDTRNPNYFFDVAGIAQWDKAAILDPLTKNSVVLSSGKALWSAVKRLQWKCCLEINEARLAAWRHKAKPKV